MVTMFRRCDYGLCCARILLKGRMKASIELRTGCTMECKQLVGFGFL